MLRKLLILLPALVAASPAAAESLAFTKSATVVSDSLGSTRSIPGAVVEYKLLYTNPLANLFTPVRNIVTSDTLPANVVMRVADVAIAGKGPVEFADGNLLGTGLLGSGLAYNFTSLGSTTDGIEFFDGTSWTYQPQPDADGYDANVRAIRVTTTGQFVTTSMFRLRFRVRIR